MSKYQALIDALEAGPTEGPWVASWDGVTTLGDHHGNQVILSANVMNDQRLIDTHYIAAANPATIRALLADLERAEKDAGRYRFLRAEHERHDPVCHLSWKRDGDRNGGEWVNTANLDADIDAALAQMAGG